MSREIRFFCFSKIYFIILEIQLKYLKYPPHCNSSLIKCNLTFNTCKHGFKLNGNRCPLCECSEKPIEECPFYCDTDLAFIPLADKLCKCIKKCPVNKCDLICKNGYKKNPNGCELCECEFGNIFCCVVFYTQYL